jgi:hypothetical protein
MVLFFFMFLTCKSCNYNSNEMVNLKFNKEVDKSLENCKKIQQLNLSIIFKKITQGCEEILSEKGIKNLFTLENPLNNSLIFLIAISFLFLLINKKNTLFNVAFIFIVCAFVCQLYDSLFTENKNSFSPFIFSFVGLLCVSSFPQIFLRLFLMLYFATKEEEEKISDFEVNTILYISAISILIFHCDFLTQLVILIISIIVISYIHKNFKINKQEKNEETLTNYGDEPQSEDNLLYQMKKRRQEIANQHFDKKYFAETYLN